MQMKFEVGYVQFYLATLVFSISVPGVQHAQINYKLSNFEMPNNRDWTFEGETGYKISY